ncbi:MAG: LPXTG cell wall anchor domain-containing protein, partial [Bryobacteraceae bacterium]
LEFVYPKSEAVKITDASAQPVLAVAPESDHLPATLSADDMKVVTLWLLTPKRIMAGNRGKGVKAVKYSGSGLGNAGGQTSEMASARPPAKRLPKTASDTFSLALWGLLSIMAAGGLYARRRRREI